MLLRKTVDSIEAVVFLIGAPGSGKSTFWSTHMGNYLRINHVDYCEQDTVKTLKNGLKLVDEETKKQQPGGIVIDNTNATAEQRQAYLKAAKSHGYRAVALVFDVDKETCMKLDKFRETNANRKHLSGRTGSIPIHTFFKQFEQPTESEGFGEIFTVNLVLTFANEDDEAFYNMIH